MTIVGALLAFIVAILFMFALRPVAAAIGLVDIPEPNGRKRHGAPVPLIGGVAMSIGLGIGASLTGHSEFWNPLLVAVFLLVAVGTIDDRFDLPASVRLIAQGCAALVVIAGSNIVVTNLGAPFFFALTLGTFAVPFTLLFFVTIINAFNVVDGLDGLAGGLSSLSLIALAITGAGTDVFVLVVLLASVVAGFLLFNLPLGNINRSVRSFMGDAGSTFLGLSIAAIGIWLTQRPGASISPAAGLWLVAVPVFDLFSAVIRRVAEGRSPFAPDHEHLHHVLMVKGLSNRTTLVVMLSLASVFAAIGLIGAAFEVPDGIMVLAWFAALTFYYQTMRRPGYLIRFVNGVQGPVDTAPTKPMAD
jgi:UDP-GlcNAc:undecaprenyl-phosphate GlcNAc-1-phosphate transferase